MSQTAPVEFIFRMATRPEEFEQIHRLNHRTFAEEIPQHAVRSDGRLVDRFHDENSYLVALAGDRVVAMLALRGRRPFSLEGKLDDLDRYLPPGRRLCEIRLLAVEKDWRGGRVFAGLLAALTDEFVAAGYDMALISGTLRQARLYRHLGFVAFGPVVGRAPALYQPMYLTLESYRANQRVQAIVEAPSVAGPVPAGRVDGGGGRS